MRRFLISIAASSLLVLAALATKAQTVNISPTFYDTLLCVKGSFNVSIVTNPSLKFEDTNIFYIEISNTTGSFSNPTQVGVIYGNGESNKSTTCTLPSNIGPGTGYRIRVTAKYPSYVSSPNGHNIRVSEYPKMTISPPSPTCAGSTLSISVSTPATTPTINWKLPNGNYISGVSYTKTNAGYTDSGNYYIWVTSYNCTSIDSTRAEVLPQPSFTGWDTDSTACEGEQFRIKPLCNVCSMPAGIVDYTWTLPAGASNMSSINILTTSTNDHGWFKLKLTIGKGSASCSASDSFFVKIKPLPKMPVAFNNSPVCVDDLLTLTSNSTTATASYKWEGPNGFTSTSQNLTRPNISKNDEGDYYVYAIDAGCKSPVAKTTVIVGNPVPQLEVTGDTTLCPGDKLQLTAQTTQSTGIEWKKAPATSQVISTARTFGKSAVDATDAGAYIVTQTILGCTSPDARINITIPDVKKPEPTTNAPVCSGENLTLELTASTNGTYQWRGPAGFNSYNQNPVINNMQPENAGTYVVTSTVDFCSITDSTTVTLKPTPEVSTINSNGPVCIGHTLEIFSESSLPKSNYQWTGPGNFTSDKQNLSFVYNNSSAGKYILKVIADGCESASKSIDITTREGAGEATATSNSPIVEEEMLKLFGTNEKPGVTFSWSGPKGFTSDEQNPVIFPATFMHSGRYELTCTYDGCTTKAYTDVHVKDVLGIKLYLHPNPNPGIFIIAGLTQTDELHTITIYNSIGKIVHRSELYPDKALFKADIDITGVTSGVYILQIISASEKRMERFTVVRQ